uniref:Uncharacterized protein n=1 Tax=Myotis myotis TaxID=51298 RepID=A0A7J7TJC1_MYOMY|nr:hypothetical protein mMyoMyo1_009088 [Myotis myotis]
MGTAFSLFLESSWLPPSPVHSVGKPVLAPSASYVSSTLSPSLPWIPLAYSLIRGPDFPSAPHFQQVPVGVGWKHEKTGLVMLFELLSISLVNMPKQLISLLSICKYLEALGILNTFYYVR